MDNQYDESKILKLTPREHVRLRPGMYFGGTDSRAMHRLLWDIIDNTVNQVSKGHADMINMTLHDAYTITIEDNGQGIPIAIDEDTGKRFLEMFFTDNGGYLDDNGKFRTKSHAMRLVHIGAVCAKMDVVVKRDGFVWEANYQIGLPTNAVRIIRPMQDGESTGTKITFSPDFEVFEKNDFQPNIIIERLKELSFLLPKTTFILIDPNGTTTTLLSQNGLVDYIHTINKAKTPLHPPISINIATEIPLNYKENVSIPIRIEVAFQYVDDWDSFILSYITLRETNFGGTHVDEFMDALSWWIHDAIKEDDNFRNKHLYEKSLYDITGGLVAVVHLIHPEPQLESQVRVRCVNVLNGIVREAVFNILKKYGEAHPDVLQTIIAKYRANYHYHRARKMGE